MSKIEWERDLVELPFCRQLEAMGWEWIQGDPDLPESTERTSSADVLLRGRLAAALRKINLRDGQPWLDEARIQRAIRDLEQAPGHRLMEVNQAATELLLKGTVVEGLPDWDQGRPQPVLFIDFEHPEVNDFLVINQFKVELTSGRGCVIPDGVLFVNGIPLVVGEFKSPGIENPIGQAVNQLLRYSNQRREVWPALYREDEGVERLFRTNQLLIASDFFEARVATLGAPPEAWLEWSDTSPVPLSQVAAELGAGPIAPGTEAAAADLALFGPEQSERGGTPLFFRAPAQRPAALRGTAVGLQSQQILVAGMLRPAHLLDLIRNFTVFQQVEGRTRKVVARYQQFRAVHKALARLAEGRSLLRGMEWDGRGGIIWHTQGSGKSLTMIFLVRKMRMTPYLKGFKVVVVTDRTDLEGQLRETARLSGETLRPNEQDQRLRESATARTQRILREPTPDICFAMLQKQTAEIFGDFIDRYVLQDAELDGATVPILYEGRTADGFVKDATGLDQLFLDLFVDYRPEELAIIKARYGTEGDVLEAPLLIEQKARDLIRHYAAVVLPEGFKAQVVATSRQAAVTYRAKLLEARDALAVEIEALPDTVLRLDDDEVDALDEATRRLVRLYPQLGRLRALEVAAVISPNHNDPESWRDWSDKDKQKALIARFKRRWAPERTDKTDPLSLLVVNNMLLTGFDAPVEQVLYLDRKILAHDLLQAIARVNRTCGAKRCGYVVDYIGVARHLNEALKDYDGADTQGTLIDIAAELPKLLDRRARAVAVFGSRGLGDLFGQVDLCVELLADLKVRAEFINALRLFYATLTVLEHRPEVPGDVFRDAKLLGFINKVAANLYRDPALNLLGVAEKVKALIDGHVSARGVDPKVPPTTITDAEFEGVLEAQSSSRARAAHMQHAARFHITGFTHQNPVYARQMSEKLEEILQRFKDDWDALERELREFVGDLKRGDGADFPDLDPRVQVPFVRLVLDFCGAGADLTDEQRRQVILTTLEMVERIAQEIRIVGFWKKPDARELLTRRLVRDLDEAGICPTGTERDLAQRLVALAKENHEGLTRR